MAVHAYFTVCVVCCLARVVGGTDSDSYHTGVGSVAINPAHRRHINHREVKTLMYLLHGRVRRETDTEDVFVCNDNESQKNWTCTCSGCERSATHKCCMSSTDKELLNQTVVVTMYKNASGDRFTSSLELRIKGAVATSLQTFCRQYPDDCPGVNNSTDTEPNRNSTYISISQNRVVFLELSHTTEKEPSTSLMAVALFVLNPVTGEDNAGVHHAVVPAKLLQKVLLNQSTSLSDTIGLGVKSIKIMDPPVVEAIAELPVKVIIAGAFLIAFMFISCVTSAVKAVRDRRLIRERNALKRELKQKRHKALHDSFRKSSPLKEKQSSIDKIENGEAVAASSNGPAAVAAPQTVQVVVHSDYHSQSDGEYSATRTPSVEYLPNPQTESSLQQETSFQNGLSGCGDVTLPNGHLKDTGSNGIVSPHSGNKSVSVSDAALSSDTCAVDTEHSPPDYADCIPPDYPNGGKHLDKSEVSYSGDGRVSGVPVSKNSEPSHTDSVNVGERHHQHPPGVVNPAYALE